MDRSRLNPSCERKFPLNHALQLVGGALQFVVVDDVIELAGLLELLVRNAQALADLGVGFGRSFLEAALELAHRQLEQAGEFDYVVDNDQIDHASDELECVVRRELALAARMET